MSDIHPEQQFEAFLAEGRFMLLRSRETGRCFWFPRVAEPGTGCIDLEWVEASGEGTVYTTTVIRQKPPTPACTADWSWCCCSSATILEIA